MSTSAEESSGMKGYEAGTGVVPGSIPLHSRNEVLAARKHSAPHSNVLWPGGRGT